MAGVELRTLQVFLTLAEELHFARTAERAGLTSSRVSQVVRELERHVGGSLFHRTSRRVALTPLGEQLYRSLTPAVAGVADALAAARDTAQGAGGRLRVGSYHVSIYGEYFFTAIRALRTTHPRLSVQTVDLGMSADPLDALRHGDVEALAMRLPLDEPDLVVGPELSCEPRVVLLARDHPLAARTAVSYEELADYVANDITSFPRSLIDAFIPPRTAAGRLMRRVPTASMNELVANVVAGEIVHPTVPSMARFLDHPGVLTVPISDLPQTRTALVWLRSSTNRAAVRALAAAVSAAAPSSTGPASTAPASTAST